MSTKLLQAVGKSTIKAFESGQRGMRDQTLVHKLSEGIKAYLPIGAKNQAGGVLTHNGEVVKHISKAEFEAMQKANIVKSGTGKFTQVIDEYTGTRYYLTPHGPAMVNDTKASSIDNGLWNQILGLFN